MSEEQNIDAEYMNRWLGDNYKIHSLSPKTLFDVQSLLEYYRDIIVPGSKVSIEFPVEGSSSGPRACVEDKEVYIPFHMLEDGRFDATIGAIIHELHHIKLSPSGHFVHIVALKFLRDIAKNIQCGNMTLSERVFSDSGITVDSVLRSDGKEVSSETMFLRKVLSDLLFLVNAAEDVRIDANTPPNLRKYIDKVDAQGSIKLNTMFDAGELNNRDLTTIAYLILGHHKKFFDSGYIAKKFGDTDDIVYGNAFTLPLRLFKAFSSEIADHVLQLYYKFCGAPQESTTQEDLSLDFDLDAYFGSKVSQEVSSQFDDAIDQIPKPSTQSDEAQAEEENALKESAEHSKAIAKQAVEESVTPVDSIADGNFEESPAELYREYLEQKKKTSVVSKELSLQVKAFKNIQVYTTTEYFNDNPVTFDAVLFDSVNQ